VRPALESSRGQRALSAALLVVVFVGPFLLALEECAPSAKLHVGIRDIYPVVANLPVKGRFDGHDHLLGEGLVLRADHALKIVFTFIEKRTVSTWLMLIPFVKFKKKVFDLFTSY